ncbi:DDE superfamily endonuclease [Popillia japonica]|uniref:DDE superfamily endonuclease n=1 Tax=Popillia japonica TaxID=7064 RepID=A0AAW1IZY9_POPJA
MGVSKASACIIMKRVSEAIASLSPNNIYMYRNQEEMEQAVQQFYNIARFPRVFGAIDCTLIKIQSPGGDDAEIYRCRKGYFAINVQTVSDANLKIRNIVARWPGSCHDQTVFNNSMLKHECVQGRFNPYLLIGDSGYSLEPYLMTPLQHTETPAENLYNESIIRTRNVVERQYGVWKRRFPILSTGIKLKLETAMTVIVATAVYSPF